VGQDSAVGKVPRYGMFGPGIESVGRDFLYLYRKSLGLTNPTTVLILLPGVSSSKLAGALPSPHPESNADVKEIIEP
jgi:hypothetical protein